MNDWLDYKGSGSARAYAANGLMSGSNISHALKDNVKNTVYGFMDKVTNADLRESEIRDRQRQADERLKQSQTERKAKEIRDAALKLRDDARDYSNEFDEYRTLYHKISPYIFNRDTSKNPRAAEQIDVAIRNMNSNLKRLEVKIKRKSASLRTELDRVTGMYNDFVNDNPISYVKDVSGILKQLDTYLIENKRTLESYLTT